MCSDRAGAGARRRLLLLVAAIAAISPLATQAAQARTTTLVPAIADAYVASMQPARSFGHATRLRVDGAPVTRVFIRFVVPTFTGTVAKATLVLYAASINRRGYSVHAMRGEGWTEARTTWRHQPRFGRTIGRSGAIAAPGWTTVDVTARVRRAGSISFALTTASHRSLGLVARGQRSYPRLLVATTGPLAAAPPPSAVTRPAVGVSSTSATLAGDVDAGGATTSYAFEYGPTSAYGSSTVTASAGAGDAAATVLTPVAGLAPATTYHFRVRAASARGTAAGADAVFATAAASVPGSAPVALTGAGTPTGSTGATLAGTVDPNGVATSYTFEWGRSVAYGSQTAATPAGSAETASDVTANLSGLAPATTYHFRLVASSATGTAIGADGSFTTATTSGSALCGTSAAAPPARYDHVIWLWMENHPYDAVIGASSAPYLNSAMVAGCGLATNYHNITHPSLPNYVAATSGGTQGIASDCSPTQCPTGADSIFAQVSAAGGSWRAYDESMPTSCSLATTSLYAPKHNPAVYFTALRNDCPLYDVPLGTAASGAFQADLGSDALPSFAFVTPNLCNDTHDCGVSTGDAWLRTWVPKIVSSPGYQAGRTALVVTWDEGEGGHTSSCALNASDQGCHVATVLIAPTVTPGSTSSTLFNHYSLLRTTEDLLGIGVHLGHAADATSVSMRSAFGF